MLARLKRPYSQPLFRKLFLAIQETHTIENFRSTKRLVFPELQTSFKNKSIRNLSSYQLLPIETAVLILCLNFVTTPPALTQPTSPVIRDSPFDKGN